MMMKFKLLLGVCFLTVFACNTSTQQSENDRLSMEEDGLTIEENELKLQDDKSTSTKQMIGQMLDSTYSDATNFNQLFDSYVFTFGGEVEKVSDATAINLYNQILDAPNKSTTQAPLFEVKNNNQVVLLLDEKGNLANIIVDKSNLSILDIRFPPASKISKLGSNVEALKTQLIGSSINFSESNFGLKPWDNSKGTGEVQIDGISGATDICQATVEILNSQLPKYQGYFQPTQSDDK